MATEKIFNSVRFGHKVDSLENWESSTLALKRGEIAFATVAPTAENGFSEAILMAKVGEDGVKTFKDLPWNFYAKASDVVAAAKDEAALEEFVNNVISSNGIASNDALLALSKQVDTNKDNIATLNGDASTEGSVAKAIADAIIALDLANTYEVKGEAAKVQTALNNYKTEVTSALADKVTKETGKSLVADAQITKLASVSEGANKVEASENNGKIKIDGVEAVVYTHPSNHAISEISGLQDALDGKQAAVDALADRVGEVAADKTVVEMIADAQAAATYDDTQVKADIKANADAIDTIESDYLKAADKEALQNQINTIMNNPDAEGAINSINEFTQYVEEHGTIAEGFRTDIDANKTNIDANTRDISDLSGRMDTAEATIEAIDNHSHENKTVIDGITSEKVAAWDGAIQTVTVGTGLKATKTGTDVTIEFDDEVVLVFDCGTSAE